MTDFLNSLLSGLGIGSIYALVALGFAFVFRTTSSFNFAQGQLVAIGSLLSYTLYMTVGVPAALTAVVVVVVVAAVGGVVERVAVFPLARRGDTTLLWLMSTLGVSVLLTGAATRLWGSESLPVDNYIGARATEFGSVSISTPYLLAFAAAVLVAVAITVFQRKTLWGRAMRAIADNRQAVELAGVNVVGLGLASYAIGAAFASIAGFIIAPIIYAQAAGGFTFTILGFAALAMGGFGSHWGALIGGWAVGAIQALAAQYLGLVYQDFAVFVVVLTALMIRPQGIFGSPVARKV